MSLIERLRSSSVDLPISHTAAATGMILGALLLISGLIGGVSTTSEIAVLKFVALALVVDLISRCTGSKLVQKIIPAMAYGILCIVIISMFGWAASYATQRLALPLRDDCFRSMDLAMGFDWPVFVRWVDSHPLFAQVLFVGYNSMGIQILLAVVILSLQTRLQDLRVYIAAYGMALLLVVLVAMLIPAMGQIATINPADFQNIKFSGATTSLADLLAVRNDVHPVFAAETGLLSFPSFHAVTGVLVTLMFRKTRLFVPVAILNAGLLTGALTEGVHYLSDILAGSGVAVLCYWLSGKFIAAEARNREHEVQELKLSHFALIGTPSYFGSQFRMNGRDLAASVQ